LLCGCRLEATRPWRAPLWTTKACHFIERQDGGAGNDVGLLAEEYDTSAERMVGNFPQAFSHVALINTAHNLARAEKPAEQRSGSDREAADQHA
jgi:hypothetical protein